MFLLYLGISANKEIPLLFIRQDFFLKYGSGYIRVHCSTFSLQFNLHYLLQVLFNPEDTEGCWVQIGIVSWGWGCGLNVTRNEVTRQLPGFYTNLPSVMPWIKSLVDLMQFN